MQSLQKIKRLAETRNKILNQFQETEGNATEIKYAAKFIEMNEFIIFDNLLFRKKNQKWEVVDLKGETIEIIIDVELQSFYAGFSQSLRGKIKKEVISLLNNELVSPKINLNYNEIAFNNGILNLELFKFYKTTKEEMNILPLIKFNFNFKEFTEINKKLEKLIKWWTQNQEEKKIVLFQIIGALISGHPLQKIFNFYGVEGSGKSLLKNLIEEIIGTNYVISTQIESLQERFGLSQILGKKIIIDGDASEKEIEPSILKKLTGSETIGIELKHKGFLQYKNKANILLISNEMLNLNGGSFEGFERRLVCFDFPFSIKNFKSRHWDLNFEPLTQKELEELMFFGENYIKKYKTEILEQIAFLALKEFSLLWNLKNNFEFKETKEMLETKQLQEQITNNVYNYFLNHFNKSIFLKLNDYEYYVKGDDLYNDYKLFTLQNGLKSFSKIKFFNKFTEILKKNNENIEKIETSKVKTIDYKSVRVFLISLKFAGGI